MPDLWCESCNHRAELEIATKHSVIISKLTDNSGLVGMPKARTFSNDSRMTTLNPSDLSEVPRSANVEVDKDDIASEQQQSFEVKSVELKEANHRLRAENVRLRNRIDYLKYYHSLERKIYLALGCFGILLLVTILSVAVSR